MNPFYQKSKIYQWIVAILLLIIVFGFCGLWYRSLDKSLAYILLMPILAPVMQFGLTPFFTLIGTYKYLSPMLLVYNPSAKKYDLHNGTSFDYLMVLSNAKAGAEIKNQILQYYLLGLLKIIELIENEELPHTVEISGSSYFFSERTAKNLGFKITNANFAEKANIMFNYADLLWMYSLANGKLRFPNLNSIKKAKISGGELIQNKAKFEQLYTYLKQKSLSK